MEHFYSDGVLSGKKQLIVSARKPDVCEHFCIDKN